MCFPAEFDAFAGLFSKEVMGINAQSQSLKCHGVELRGKAGGERNTTVNREQAHVGLRAITFFFLVRVPYNIVLSVVCVRVGNSGLAGNGVVPRRIGFIVPFS